MSRNRDLEDNLSKRDTLYFEPETSKGTADEIIKRQTRLLSIVNTFHLSLIQRTITTFVYESTEHLHVQLSNSVN